MATAKATVRGTHQVVFALRQHGEEMEREMASELDVLAQQAARRMRELAAKSRTELTNSIAVSAPEPLVREVRPGSAHGWFVEHGVKAGGKGLPRFFDPASRPIVAWLESKAFSGSPRVRLGTGKFSARELELRDRYEGLAWHIRHHGVKAQPFVEPTARETQQTMLTRMDLAVRRVLARTNDGGAGGAVA